MKRFSEVAWWYVCHLNRMADMYPHDIRNVRVVPHYCKQDVRAVRNLIARGILNEAKRPKRFGEFVVSGICYTVNRPALRDALANGRPR